MKRTNHPKRGTVMIRVSRVTRQVIKDLRSAKSDELGRTVETPELMWDIVQEHLQRLQAAASAQK